MRYNTQHDRDKGAREGNLFSRAPRADNMKHNTYFFDFLESWQRFFRLLQIAPIRLLLLIAPFGVFPFLQHGTEVHAAGVRHIHLHLGRVLAVYVGHNDLIFTLIVRLRLAYAQCDRVGFAVGEEFEATTFVDLGDALIELERWRW